MAPSGFCLCSCIYLICLTLWTVVQVHKVVSVPVAVTLEEEQQSKAGFGEPVWSHGESYSTASASGPGAMVETDSWTLVNNHGGLQVNNVTSNGTVIGYQVLGMTNCSQESWASAIGAWTANALAYGLCNSSVLLDQPVSNTGVGNNATKIGETNKLNK